VGASSLTIRNMIFAGSYNSGTLISNVNTFAETISDIGSGPGNNTNVTIKSASDWALTGTNTYSGATTLASTGAVVELNNASSLGTGTLTYSANATAAAIGAITVSNPLLISASTYTAHLVNATAGAPSTANTFNYSGLITGTGTLTPSTLSNSSYGAIELSNDSNSYSNFSMGFGYVEFTSVANPGQVSALGAGTGPYIIADSSSAATFDYIGNNNDSTTLAIDWTGTASTTGLYIESSGGGTVQYLATTPIRTGTGGADVLNLNGTNTGNNVLLQPINDQGGVTSLAKPTATASEPDSGNWTLGGSSTYSGPTTVNGGTLTIDADDYSGASITGSTSISIGAAGALHLLNMNATANVSILNSNAVVSVVTGAAVTLDLAGYTQTISTFDVNGSPQTAGLYGSATYFADIGDTSLTLEQTADESYFGTSDGAFNVVNSPEPGSLAIIGVGAFGLLIRRRRAVPRVM
jgi:autotransporter-associated beta strand protein